MSDAAAHPLPKVQGMEQTSTLGVSWNKLMMWLFLGSDGMSFAGLLCAYFFFRIRDPHWPDPGHELGIWLTTFMTFVLICSSFTMVKALAAVKAGDRKGLGFWLLMTMIGGTFFLLCQVYEWQHLIIGGGHSVSEHLFWGTFFVMTGFHGCHVLSGVIYLGVWWVKNKMGKELPNAELVEAAGLFWHFVDLVWVFIFTFVYLIPPIPHAS